MERKIVERDAGAQTMLYDAERDELHVLNATARLIYRLSREGKGITEIEESIRNLFRTPFEYNLRGEIEECLETFKQKGL